MKRTRIPPIRICESSLIREIPVDSSGSVPACGEVKFNMEFCACVVGTVRKTNDNSVHLEIKPEYWDAVLQLDKFSHIIVLWWITGRDNPEDRSRLRVNPPKTTAELSGVFATRSPARPTPIGISVVAVRGIDDANHRILIDQIDAFDETPIIDIKPYMPSSDRVDDAQVPEWFKDNVARYTT